MSEIREGYMKILDLRRAYHQQICQEIIRVKRDPQTGVDYPNFADCGNTSSVRIATGITQQLHYLVNNDPITEQTAGDFFEKATRKFIKKSFQLLQHLRPGKWHYAPSRTAISRFGEYQHLAYLENVIKKNKSLSSALRGDIIVKPDIVIGRYPIGDREVNQKGKIIHAGDGIATLTPLRRTNCKNPSLVLHTGISCNWTIKGNRSEALNLIRNRGHLPHIVAVTAEPLPTRIATLALGTGDIDSVYHFALPELKKTIEEMQNQDLLEPLLSMIEGKRLRDISDLPFDLAI